MMTQIDRYDIIEVVGRDRFANIHKPHETHIRLSSLLSKLFTLVVSDRDGNRQARLPLGRAVRGVFGFVIMVAMILLQSCLKVDEPAELPTVLQTEADLETEAKPTVTEPAADTLENREDAGVFSRGHLKEVAREDTLSIGADVVVALGVTNPWAPGYSGHDGDDMMWEGLAYWQIFADQKQPWLAESMDYNQDFTELTINVRPEARWSDGTPLTAKDVVFTFEGQLKIETLPYHASFQQFVQEIKTVDDHTVVLHFSQPAPRFAFEVLTLKFDTGIFILPAHVLEPMDDPTVYTGGLEMPHSGPYTTVFWDETRMILDLREDWWAVEASLIDTPDVKRIDIAYMIESSVEDVAHKVTDNEFDTSYGLSAEMMAGIIEQNPEVTSHTGDQPPFGYLDYWPNSLILNTQLPPYNDARVRRAISLAIDRDRIDQVVYQGTQVTTIFPFPLYPGLQRFVDRPDMQALIEHYQPGKFDPKESAALMESAGFALNQDGFWEKDYATLDCTIHGFQGIHGDILPMIANMLVHAGFNASVNFGSDAYQRMIEGAPGLYMIGHGGSIIDPYATLELFHGRYSTPVGTLTDAEHLSRYNNPAYDAILDEMAPLASGDPRFLELATQAMEIYWAEQIDIPIIQWFHRFPYNQTYWTNWPTANNLGPGVNGALHHTTGMLVVTSLEKAK
jgi:ABC-type transport system substrate-binding protein